MKKRQLIIIAIGTTLAIAVVTLLILIFISQPAKTGNNDSSVTQATGESLYKDAQNMDKSLTASDRASQFYLAGEQFSTERNSQQAGQSFLESASWSRQSGDIQKAIAAAKKASQSFRSAAKALPKGDPRADELNSNADMADRVVEDLTKEQKDDAKNKESDKGATGEDDKTTAPSSPGGQIIIQ